MTEIELLSSMDWRGLYAELGLDSIEERNEFGTRGKQWVVILEADGRRRQVDVTSFMLQSTSIFPGRDFRRHLTAESLALHAEPLTGICSTYHRQIDLAERRGDVAGADAWRTAIEAIETARRVVDKAGSQQTWNVAE